MLTGIIAVAIGLGVMVLVHEWGHFMAAKLFGVRVVVFSIGYGTRLFGWKSGDTDYRVSVLPLGGYVRLAGDNPVEERTGAPLTILLDEPTSDLDPLTASGIDELIVKLNDSLGITVVIVTHDLTTLFTICRRIAVLVDKKITVGTLAELMRSDQPWVHEFLHGPRAQGAMTARKHSHGNG